MESGVNTDTQLSVVIGVGIDLCELDRIASMLNRLGETFLRRAYTPIEQEYIGNGPDAPLRCAGLFAAKEAVVKCLGTGFASGVGWKQVQVVPKNKFWQVTLFDEALRIDRVHHSTRWMIDVHYTRTHACAAAIWTAAGQ